MIQLEQIQELLQADMTDEEILLILHEYFKQFTETVKTPMEFYD